MGAPVAALFLPLDAAAAVRLAEQDTLSRRRISGSGGWMRACPSPYNTHLAVQFYATLCDENIGTN